MAYAMKMNLGVMREMQIAAVSFDLPIFSKLVAEDAKNPHYRRVPPKLLLFQEDIFISGDDTIKYVQKNGND
jgi:hypothetical protein